MSDNQMTPAERELFNLDLQLGEVELWASEQIQDMAADNRALREQIAGADALIVRLMCGDGPGDDGLISTGQAWREAIPPHEREALDRAMPDLFS